MYLAGVSVLELELLTETALSLCLLLILQKDEGKLGCIQREIGGYSK